MDRSRHREVINEWAEEYGVHLDNEMIDVIQRRVVIFIGHIGRECLSAYSTRRALISMFIKEEIKGLRRS